MKIPNYSCFSSEEEEFVQYVVIVTIEDTTDVDALNFNNLLISAKGATSPLVKKLLMSQIIYFSNTYF
jgi:hypothetical protein